MCQISQLPHMVTLTVGQPVSAIDMTGLLGRVAAKSTLLVVKKSHVQPAASFISTPPNHGCTLDICRYSCFREVRMTGTKQTHAVVDSL
jgi:hypothetical protein